MVRLSEDDSPAKVLDATERHMRLCSQIVGGEKYRLLVHPFYNDMVLVKNESETLSKAVIAAQDSLTLFDSIIDDLLRDTQGRAKEYDRAHPGSNLLTMIFPNGVITPIINMNNHDEPATVQGIILKIRSLGEQHPLYPLAAQLDKGVADCLQSIKKEEDAIEADGTGLTKLTLAKIKLVRQYNANYFIAGTDVDKNFAEKLFPKLRPGGKKDDNDSSSDGKNT